MSKTTVGSDGKVRCHWCSAAPAFLSYHDTEWGFPVDESSLAAFIWRYEPETKQLSEPQTVSTSAASVALSKDLKKLGWKFVGPTTVYAFIQAMGLINDHVADCVIRDQVARARKRFNRPG